MASFLYGIIAIIYMTVFVVILVIISTILLKVLYAYYCPEISNPSYLPATYSTPCYILHLNYMGVVGLAALFIYVYDLPLQGFCFDALCAVPRCLVGSYRSLATWIS